MTSDLDLLGQFAREKSQEAFTALVNRHVNLIYSAALRQVRSPQLAEEITQSVFADLARVAATPSSPLSGCDASSQTRLTPWLYAVTRRTAIDAIRKESRRQLREQIAMEMNDMNATANDWTQIEPLLDDAMAALDETDRSAILLRYFENKTLREVGEALGTNDDAAQKRVSRAVERLREFFSKRKITIGASGLAILISANAVQSAPIGLAVTISAAAVLTGTAVSISTVITTTKAIAMTTLQKTAVTAMLAAAVGTGIFEVHQAVQLRNQVQILQQQMAPLAAQLQQLQNERAAATNRLASLLAENEQLKSNSNETELLKLRGEVGRLKIAEMQNQNDPIEIAAKAWLMKVNLLKQRLDQVPNEKIPELQFATEIDWLNAANCCPKIETDADYRWGLHILFGEVEDKFGNMAMKALQKYIKANNEQFPTDVSQLQLYFDTPVDDAILQRYEIVPANTIPKAKEMSVSWLIVQTTRVDENDKNDQREVIGPSGYGSNWTFW